MKVSKLVIAVVMVIATGPTGIALAQHWGYEGEAAPQNWGKLDAKFALCASGKNQSPIDLGGFVKADLKPLKLDYKAGIADILNNGHTVQINYPPGSSLAADGVAFELKQFHFHSPSENKVNGKQFPLEGHGARGQRRQSRGGGGDVPGRRRERVAHQAVGEDAQ